jgi:hypothetical protein
VRSRRQSARGGACAAGERIRSARFSNGGARAHEQCPINVHAYVEATHLADLSKHGAQLFTLLRGMSATGQRPDSENLIKQQEKNKESSIATSDDAHLQRTWCHARQHGPHTRADQHADRDVCRRQSERTRGAGKRFLQPARLHLTIDRAICLQGRQQQCGGGTCRRRRACYAHGLGKARLERVKGHVYIYVCVCVCVVMYEANLSSPTALARSGRSVRACACASKSADSCRKSAAAIESKSSARSGTRGGVEGRQVVVFATILSHNRKRVGKCDGVAWVCRLHAVDGGDKVAPAHSVSAFVNIYIYIFMCVHVCVFACKFVRGGSAKRVEKNLGRQART